MVNAVLLRPLPYPESDRLVGLWHSFPGLGVPQAEQAPGTYASYRRSAKLFEDMGADGPMPVTITYHNPRLSPERLRAGAVTGSIFSVLRVRPVMGRTLTHADEQPGAPPVAVIGERLWRQRFDGDRHIIGRAIQVDRVEREIVGVVPTGMGFPESDTQLWIPFDVEPKNGYLGSFTFQAIGRLRPGVSLSAAQRELQQVLNRAPESYKEVRPGIATGPLLERAKATVVIHSMRDDVVGDFDRVLWLIAATVALLVLVALSNVASLRLVRMEALQREFAIRAALGASAASVWRGLATEIGIVAATGGAIGLGLAYVALRVFIHTAPAGIPRLNDIHMDAAAVGVALLLTALFALVSGGISASRVMAIDTMRVLRESGRSGMAGHSRQRLRTIFVGVQVALSLALLSGSAVTARSLLRLRDVRPGFNPANVMTFWTSLPSADYKTKADIARFYRDAVQRMEQLPGVDAAAVVSKLPLQVAGTTGRLVWVEGAPVAEGMLPAVYQVTSASDGYFRAMQIPVLSGRTFDRASVTAGQNEVVASQGFVTHYWRDATGRKALGRRIRVLPDGPWYTIVGVVGDLRDTSLTAAPTSSVYFPEDFGSDTAVSWQAVPTMSFVVRSRKGATPSPAALDREIRGLDPNLPIYRISSMDQTVAEAGSRMTFALLLMAASAITTLALGVLGLYGIISYVVRLRTREIGVRIALGLPPAGAARMILRQGEVIVVAGAVAGLVVFVAFSRLLTRLVFGVSTVDVNSLVVATVVILGIATVATWIPARRAAQIDPMEALRSE